MFDWCLSENALLRLHCLNCNNNISPLHISQPQTNIEIFTWPDTTMSVNILILHKFFVNTGLLTKKKFIINGTQEENENDNGEQQHDNDFIKLYCAILSCPGKVVSLSVLNKQGILRKAINGKTGKALMAEVTH